MHRLQVTDLDLLVCLMCPEIFAERSPPNPCSWVAGSSPMLLQTDVLPASFSKPINWCLKAIFNFCSKM